MLGQIIKKILLILLMNGKMNKINKLMKILPMIMVFLMPFLLVGAAQSVLIQKSEKFVEYFNQNDSKSVHKMFSIEMNQCR